MKLKFQVRTKNININARLNSKTSMALLLLSPAIAEHLYEMAPQWTHLLPQLFFA